jgi:hypothetical protein
MKAHDVRHLRVCKDCDRLGDQRRGMLQLPDGHHHDFCLIARMTLGELLRLPVAERDKITLGAAGPALMRSLLDCRHLQLVKG